MNIEAAKRPHPTARDTLLALLPGLVAATFCYDGGPLLNLLASAAPLLAVAASIPATGQAIRTVRMQGACITAIVLALTLPPALPFWLSLTAAAVAAVAGRAGARLPLNAAMLGCALLFVCAPAALTPWPLPHALDTSAQIQQFTTGARTVDAVAGATALVRMEQRAPLTRSEVREQTAVFGSVGAAGVEWTACAWLLGGVWLWRRRAIAWQTPVACIGAIVAAALLGYRGDDSSGGASPLHHLFSGGTLLVAWFVLTEPHSAARSNGGRLLTGALSGALIYATRESGGGGDRSAFVVLLANALAPSCDALAQRIGSRPR